MIFSGIQTVCYSPLMCKHTEQVAQFCFKQAHEEGLSAMHREPTKRAPKECRSEFDKRVRKIKPRTSGA